MRIRHPCLLRSARAPFYHRVPEDVGAVIAYLRSLPPVTRTLWTAGQLPAYDAARIDHAKPSVVRVAMGPTPEYGHYLANGGGCTGCHGATLSGGPMPGMPKPPANLTPTGIGTWTEADFRTALRDGRRPDGSPIDSTMPWKASGKMTDQEIAAVYAYLKTVPAKAFGGH